MINTLFYDGDTEGEQRQHFQIEIKVNFVDTVVYK